MEFGEWGLVILILCILGVAGWIRKHIKNSKWKGRAVPFREPLVSEDLWKICNHAPQAPYTVVWLLHQYAPKVQTELVRSIHSWNLYMKDVLGWNPVVFVPESDIQAWDGIPVLQFYQTTELSQLLRAANCIGTGPMIYEMAAATAKGCRKPVMAIVSEEADREEFKKGQKVWSAVSVVFTSDGIRERWGIGGEVLHEFLPLKPVASERQQIVGLLNSPEEVEEFLELARGLPELYFLGVSRIPEEANCPEVPLELKNAVLWRRPVPRERWLEVAKIVIVFSGSWDCLEAVTSGIPVLASEENLVAREALGGGAEFVDRRKRAVWVEILREWSTNSVAYEKQVRLAKARVNQWTPKEERERLRLQIEAQGKIEVVVAAS